MRGYFTIINDVPYDLGTLSLTQASKIRGVEGDHIDVVERPDQKAIELNLTFANLTKETYTNAKLAEYFKDLLRTKKITKMTQLSSVATVYIEYTVVDNYCNAVVDHGVGVKEVTGAPFLFPLGITEENEYVSRMGLEFAVNVTQRYRPKNPYGIMSPRQAESYRVYINRIVVSYLADKAWSVAPTLGFGLSGRPNCGCSGHHGSYGRPPRRPGGLEPIIQYGENHWGNPYWFSGIQVPPVRHPSYNDVIHQPGDVLVDKNDLIIAFDSATVTTDDCLYASAEIPFAPQAVVFNFNLKALLPILIKREEIEELMAEIQKTVDEEASKKDEEEGEPVNPPLTDDEKDPTDPPETPPTTDTPETPGNGTDAPLTGDEEDQKDPTTEDTSGSGTGTTEETQNPEETESGT